jgi:hypothetical protein
LLGSDQSLSEEKAEPLVFFADRVTKIVITLKLVGEKEIPLPQSGNSISISVCTTIKCVFVFMLKSVYLTAGSTVGICK